MDPFTVPIQYVRVRVVLIKNETKRIAKELSATKEEKNKIKTEMLNLRKKIEESLD